MGEQINKDFEKFQNELKKRDKKIKYVTSFTPSSNLDDVLNELKNKEVNL